MRLPRPKAFTFVEVIAALAIISIALLGLLHLHLLSIRTADAAQHMAAATFLAQEKMAQASWSERPRVGTGAGTAEIDGACFAWRTEVTNVDAPPLQALGLDTLHRLHVDVTWSEGAGQKRIQMTTYIADSRIHE